jgi:twitching motility protein PilT
VNRTRDSHIVTIEDPIEFVHRGKRCVVTQREVGTRTHSFKGALRAALREDPDVGLIGEMRDLETVSIALETADTGHLVFGTLHTMTAAATVDRIIDQFPTSQQEQIRAMLADALDAVIAQTLCRRRTGGRVAAREVLFNTAPVANLTREAKTVQIPTIMQTSKARGMVTMNAALELLVAQGRSTPRKATRTRRTRRRSCRRCSARACRCR